VTVMVVNLYYNDPNILPERGFGYLIPRSISFDQNPECALGVVFDSDTTIGQDSVPGTKVTVMLGGHWWDGFDSYPDEEEGAAMAKAILKRHLRIEIEPEVVNVGLQRECIPQYTVGHEERMKRAHGELMSAFKGKLTVAGNSYTGVGLNDCVRAARDAVMGVKKGEENTGLEEFARPRAWVDTKLPSRSELERELARRQGPD
jgi:oxygen-dependent protoporphyrinogen oxidase